MVCWEVVPIDRECVDSSICMHSNTRISLQQWTVLICFLGKTLTVPTDWSTMAGDTSSAMHTHKPTCSAKHWALPIKELNQTNQASGLSFEIAIVYMLRGALPYPQKCFKQGMYEYLPANNTFMCPGSRPATGCTPNRTNFPIPCRSFAISATLCWALLTAIPYPGTTTTDCAASSAHATSSESAAVYVLRATPQATPQPKFGGWTGFERVHREGIVGLYFRSVGGTTRLDSRAAPGCIHKHSLKHVQVHVELKGRCCQVHSVVQLTRLCPQRLLSVSGQQSEQSI